MADVRQKFPLPAKFVGIAGKRNGYWDGHGCTSLRVLIMLFILALIPGYMQLAAAVAPLTLLAHTQSLTYPALQTQVLADGVTESTEQVRTQAGLEKITLLSVDLTSPHVRLGIVTEHNRLLGGGETVSSMAARSGAIAGVNGDYFEITKTGDPLGMVEINGQLWQSPTTFDILGVTAGKRVVITHETFSGSVTSADSSSYALHSLNRHSDIYGDNLVLFNSLMGTTFPGRQATVAILQPGARSSDTFTVQTIQSGVTTMPVLRGNVALAADGHAIDWMNSHLAPGTVVHIHQSVAPDTHLALAIGGGDVLIKNGAAFHDPATLVTASKTRAALTAVGISRDERHILLVVCDGGQRDAIHSQGLTGNEMASYLLTHGAYQAIMLDGGGSSEMVARMPGRQGIVLLNTIASKHERPVADGLFVYH